MNQQYSFCWNCMNVEKTSDLKPMLFRKDSKKYVLICIKCKTEELLK